MKKIEKIDFSIQDRVFLPPMNGARTILRSAELLKVSRSDRDFYRKFGIIDMPGIPTKDAETIYYNVSYCVSFGEIFRSFADDLPRMALSQEQIVNLLGRYGRYGVPRFTVEFYLTKFNEDFCIVSAYGEYSLDLLERSMLALNLDLHSMDTVYPFGGVDYSDKHVFIVAA